MLKTFTTSPINYEFDGIGEHIISVQNNASYDFSHDVQTHDGLIELSIPFYDDYALQQIPDKAFMNCADLSSIEGKKIKTIGKYAFNFCDNLRYANIPEVTKLKQASFKDCNLSIVILSNALKVTEIETDTFQNNFRRPISVYFPQKLSNDWYDSNSNNSWKYVISSQLSAISASFADEEYGIAILKGSGLTYNNQVNAILLSTANKTTECKEIWDRLYPNIHSNFTNLVNTLSILVSADANDEEYIKPENRSKLLNALSSSEGDSLSDIIIACNINNKDRYEMLSSANSGHSYYQHLRTITQFPVYDLSAISIYERYRPLSSEYGILSNKVDYETVKKDIYRTVRNTVEELDDIFQPLSNFCHLLSSGQEISANNTTFEKDMNAVSSAIQYYCDAQMKFRDIIR